MYSTSLARNGERIPRSLLRGNLQTGMQFYIAHQLLKTNLWQGNYLTATDGSHIYYLVELKAKIKLCRELGGTGLRGTLFESASPTVEPDPDNAGVGKLLIQAVRYRIGLFCSKGSRRVSLVQLV